MITVNGGSSHFTIHIYPDVAGRGDATELLGAQQYAAHRRKLSEVRVVYPSSGILMNSHKDRFSMKHF